MWVTIEKKIIKRFLRSAIRTIVVRWIKEGFDLSTFLSHLVMQRAATKWSVYSEINIFSAFSFCPFSRWQNAASLPCSFFCCVFYTRQIGNYVYFIVFFPWIFRNNRLYVVHSLALFVEGSLLSIAAFFLLNCLLTFFRWFEALYLAERSFS